MIDRWRSIRSPVVDRLLALLESAVARLPWATAQAVGSAVGGLAWSVAARDRRRVLAHLGIAFPALTARERKALGRRVFLHLGTTLGECLHLGGRGPEAVREVVSVEGWERMEAAATGPGPTVVVTGHCGNWELLAATINVWGRPLAVLARGLDDERLGRRLVAFRARFGTETITRGGAGSARQLLGALRGAGALGALIDQDTKVDGVWVPFFGRLAHTPVGVAHLAVRHRATVVPAFIERERDGRHRAVFHPPLDLPADPTAATALMTASIEAQIRRRPEQWVWMHRRWRHRPPGEGGPSEGSVGPLATGGSRGPIR